MDEAEGPCVLSLWTSKCSSKLHPCFRGASQPGVLLVCVALALRGTAWEDGQMAAQTDHPTTQDPAHNTCAAAALTHTVPLTRSAFPFLLRLSSFRAGAKMCAYARKTTGCCALQPWAAHVPGHAHSGELDLSILSFPILIKTLSCFIRREH